MRPRRFSTGNNARIHSPLVPGTSARETHSPGPSSINSENTCLVFNVGDNIDALCNVQNGSQRWFPGSITRRSQVDGLSGADSPIATSYTYSIVFHDGETKDHVPASDIRLTKNSKSRASSRVSSSRRDSHSLGSFPHLMPANVSFTAEVVKGLEKVAEASPEKKTQQSSSHDITADAPSSSSGDMKKDDEEDEDLLLQRLDRAHANKRGGIAAVPTVPTLTPPSLDNSAESPVERMILKREVSSSSVSSNKTVENIRMDALGSAGEIFETPTKVYSPVQFISKANRREKDSLGSISIDDALDASYEDDEDDDDDNSVFVIPLVYSRQGSARGTTPTPADNVAFASSSGVVVPRMQLAKLDLASSVDHGGSTASLSGALLRESSKPNLLDSADCSSPGDALSPRGAVDKILSDFARDDASAGSLTRVESWRESVGWNTRRSSGAHTGGLSKSSRLNSSTNSLLSLVNLSNAQTSQEALKIIQVAQTDIQEEIVVLESMCGTYATIASFIVYGALTELADRNVLMPRRSGVGGGIGTNKSDDVSNPLRSTSNASGQAESSFSYEVSHDYDDFDDAPESAENRHMSHIALFAVREFLDLEIPSICAAHVLSTASFVGPDAVRMLKLLSKTYFSESCISLHLKNSDRLSAGAFGTVFQVCCPSECSVSLKAPKDCNYAVKRIVRERSVHDAPVILDVFSEVSCLERMASCRGVCSLIDYGVYEGEYWVVMEKGSQDLHEWALLYLSKSEKGHKKTKSHSSSDDASVKKVDVAAAVAEWVDKLLVYICIFAECVRIVGEVHAERIIHFDIKCSNFIMRQEVRLDKLVNAVMTDTFSGDIFLADFGESLCASETHYFNSKKKRSRGTLPVQSPEMLAVNDRSELKWQPSSNAFTESPSYGCDVWSLGCMLFEMKTGQFLFQDKSWTELYCILCMQQYEPPDVTDSLTCSVSANDIPELVKSASATLCKVVRGTLQQHPADRTKIPDLLREVKDVVNTLLPFRSACDQTMSPEVCNPPISKETERIIASQQLSISRNILSLEGFPVGEPEPCRNDVVVSKGVWLVSPVVSLNIGCTFEPAIDGNATVSQKRAPPSLLAPRSGVVASLAPLHMSASIKAQGDRTASSLDEFEMNMSAIVSYSGISSTCSSAIVYNDMVFKRMIVRCISNHFSTVSPSLSYYTMSAVRHMRVSSTTRITSSPVDEDNACVTANITPTLAQPVKAVVTVVRIGDAHGESRATGTDSTQECGFTSGALTPAFLSPTQYHCLLSNDLDYDNLCKRTMSVLRFSFNEICAGRSIAIVVDSKPLGSSSFSPRHSYSPQERLKVEVASCRLTVALFLACAIGTIESFSKLECVNDRSRADYISECAEKEFRWCLASIDVELYRRLCVAVDVEPLDANPNH